MRQQGKDGHARRARPGHERDRWSVRSGSSGGAGRVAGAQDVQRAAADSTGGRRSGRRGVRARRARGHPRIRGAEERPAATGHAEFRVLALGLPGPGQRLFPVSRPDHRSPAGEPGLHDRDEQAVPGGAGSVGPGRVSGTRADGDPPAGRLLRPDDRGDGAAERVRAGNGHASPRRPHSGGVRRRPIRHLPPGDRRRQRRLRGRGRIVHLRVPERPGGDDPLVPRPRPGRHALQPDGRPRRLLPHP